MDSHFVQNLRYKLQRRIRRINGIDANHFGPALKQMWPFIRKSELFMAILEPVLRHRADLAQSAQTICSGQPVLGETELETVGIAFHVLERVVVAENPQELAFDIGFGFTHSAQGSEPIDAFRELFVEPIYEYLDEQLDNQRAVCALLVKYKHRSEWFTRSELHSLVQDSARGEKKLAVDLYRYLHDQGMEFHIEPRSVSGEVDLLGDQRGDQRMVLDAKIFDPEHSKGKAYLVRAFNQVYTYARDYNESAGYLAIYQTTTAEPKFTFAANDCIFPYLEHNGKVIYFVVIDICDYDQSASKRGQARVVEVTQDDLLGGLEAAPEGV
jgi:hypothetical protein